jgi:non-specific serine/threonine protein kinase
LQLLRDVPQLETAGVVVRMPAAWRGSRPPRPKVTGTVGTKTPSGLGQDALLDFRMDVTLDGEPLTAAEIRDLLARTDGLALVRGRWVEIDREHLQSMIDRFGEVGARPAERPDLRRPCGCWPAAPTARCRGYRRRRCRLDASGRRPLACGDSEPGCALRRGLAQTDPGDARSRCAATHNGQACAGFYLLTKLRLGACLADDMGLGKTIQVLSLLLVLRASTARGAAEPAGGAGLPFRQLGGRNRTLRTEFASPVGSSATPAPIEIVGTADCARSTW